MGKPDQGSAAAEGARMATGDAAGPGRGGRLSVGRKREVVLRLLRGEDLESVSRAVGITAARASQWRDRFLAAGQASLKSRAPDARNEDDRRLQATIGELLRSAPAPTRTATSRPRAGCYRTSPAAWTRTIRVRPPVCGKGSTRRSRSSGSASPSACSDRWPPPTPPRAS